MQGGWFTGRLSDLSLIGVVLMMLVSTLSAAFLGNGVRRLRLRLAPVSEAGERYQESYFVGSMLGLLALLLAFSFAMGIDRYEERRRLVVQEANAIGTSYLRAQLLDEPHRSRLSKLLVEDTDNRIELGAAEHVNVQRQLAVNDRLITEIWAGVTAARDSTQIHGISVPVLATFNEVINLDIEWKVARTVRIPETILTPLYGFLVMTAGVLGFVLEERRAWLGAFALFVLLSLYVSIIADLNRPASGNIRESQEPMLMLRQSLKNQPPQTFDRFKTMGLSRQ